MRRVIYAGSFDPVTNGHIGIISQAAAIFGEVIVAIGINPDKKSMFTVEERKEMLRQSTADIPNVRIDSFEGFLPNYALEIGAGVIVRGLRSAADFEAEQGMRYVYDKINPLVQVTYLIAEKELSEVSSSLVKGLVGADPSWEDVVKEYVPEPVFQKLKEGYEAKAKRPPYDKSKTLKVAITGNIASGKSAVQDRLKKLGFPVFDTDDAAHEVLELDQVKKWLSDAGLDVFEEDGAVSRSKLGKLVFADDILRKQLEGIMHPLIKEMTGSFFGSHTDDEIAFVAVPLLFETGTESEYDKVIVVYTEDDVRKSRLMDRGGLTSDQAQLRMDTQESQAEKVEKSDYIINNSGDLAALDKQIETILGLLQLRYE